MADNTSAIRVSNHNNWPIVQLFPCENDFVARMANQNIQQIFVTAKLASDDFDEPFNSAVGHILDCLDSLPKRPDAAFDSLYKVIDQNLGAFTATGLSPAKTMLDSLFQTRPVEWDLISETLAANMPRQTADYAASRILDCHIVNNPPHSGRMKARALRSLGQHRYPAFYSKYLVQNPQNITIYDLPYENRRNAGRLMHMFFTKIKDPSHIPDLAAPTNSTVLDLSVQNNILSSSEKLHSLVEICLSTYRHERFHGEAFSPFRSSKAGLKTYAHAYYMLMVAYIIVLGVLQFHQKGGLIIDDVVAVAQKSMARFSTFFAPVLNE